MDEDQTKVVPERGNTWMSGLPGGVQVLIDWVIFLFSTLASYFTKKKNSNAEGGE